MAFKLAIFTTKHSLKAFTNRHNVRLASTVSNFIIQNQNDEQEKAKENIIIRKFHELNDWYFKFTGLDEVKKLQDRVIITQERLEKAQEERREIGKLLADVRKKSTELQEQLHKVKRYDDVQRFLDLTREEMEVIKMEKELTAKFEVLDKSEREIFTRLSNAVRDSHEREKAQSEYTKYWSIILSIIGTIVGGFISTIISTMRNRDIVRGINNGVEQKFIELTNKIAVANQVNSGLSVDNIIQEIRHDNYKNTLPILDKLNENQRQINVLLNNVKTDYVLSADKIKDGDENLDVGAFISAERNLLEEHQKEIKTILYMNEYERWFSNRLILIGGAALVLTMILFR